MNGRKDFLIGMLSGFLIGIIFCGAMFSNSMISKSEVRLIAPGVIEKIEAIKRGEVK